MLFLQIRQAEVALDDGRLDEAYQLVQSPKVRSHRKGQALVNELVDKLLARARAHLSGGRPLPALADCEKAQALGGNLDDATGLRNQIEQAMLTTDRQRREGARDHALQAATALVDSAMERRDVDRAVSELMRARANGCSDHRLREHDANLRTTLASDIESAVGKGWLDQAELLLGRLNRLDGDGLATQQLGRAMHMMRCASQDAANGKYRDAVHVLQRLSVQYPEAGWIKETINHLLRAAEALESVQCGPLGFVIMSNPPPDDRPQPTPRVDPVDPRTPSVGLPPKFVLQVDGAGSYQVVSKSRVTLGPISSSQMPDIGLMAEPGAPVVSIERVEDDYFVQQPGSPRRLLNNGDRISISPRCVLIFTMPSSSSTSAVLELAGGRFPRADIRRVILLDRDLVIGPGTNAHVRADQLAQPLVLAIRNGSLACRNEQLAIGKPANISGLSFALSIA